VSTRGGAGVIHNNNNNNNNSHNNNTNGAMVAAVGSPSKKSKPSSVESTEVPGMLQCVFIKLKAIYLIKYGENKEAGIGTYIC